MKDDKQQRTIRALTYNIHHGKGNDGRVSLPRIALVIQRSGADLVALQEVDCLHPRSGFKNQACRLARLVTMSCAFGVNKSWFFFIKYGNAVLSRFPILYNRNFELPFKNEPRGLLLTEITLPEKIFWEQKNFLSQHPSRFNQERAAAAGRCNKPCAGLP